jgi:predicted RNA-binding protein with TRAM domain
MNEYRKPVDKGDEIEVKIESTGAKGDGIAKVNNFVIIVPGAKEGENVKVRITRVLKKMAFAEIVNGESSSSEEESSEEQNSSSDDDDTEEIADEEADEMDSEEEE